MDKTDTMQNLKANNSYKQIIGFSLPIAFTILVPSLNFLINNSLLGHYSTNVLNIAGITGVYYLIFSATGNGINNAAQSVLSYYAGKEQLKKFNSLFNQVLILSLLISLISILITYIISPIILKSILKNSLDTENIIGFLKIRILGLPFLLLFQIGNSILLVSLKTKFIIIGSIIENISNIFLDYCFIFGKFGFPEMGFMGAAYASILAEAIGAATVFMVLYKTKIAQFFKLNFTFRYNKIYFNEILKPTLPLIVQYLISIITWLVFFVLIKIRNIENESAISNVMRNVFSLVGVFVWSLAATTNNLVANLRGQNKFNEINILLKRICLVGFISVFLLSLILFCFSTYFFQLFNFNTNTTALAKQVLNIVLLAIFIMSIAVVYLNALIGLGLSKINLFVEVVSIIFYLIYSIYICNIIRKNLIWCWGNEFVYWFLSFLISYIFVRKKLNSERLIANKI